MSNVLEGYEVESQVKKGLYVARRGSSRFAVKTFEAEPPATMKAALKLSGPWVAEVREVGMLDTRHALVREWVDGMPLSELVAANGPRLTQTLALQIAFQVARALTAAHELEDGAVIHGALDLTHVLCGKDGAVKVCNFGGGTVRDGRLRAHPGFVPPEVMGGEVADMLTDVYACGALAYLLLTGRTPGEASLTNGGTVPAPSKLNPGLGDGLDAALLEMVAGDAAERSISTRILTAAIDRYAEELDLELDGAELAAMVRGKPVMASPPPPPVEALSKAA